MASQTNACDGSTAASINRVDDLNQSSVRVQAYSRAIEEVLKEIDAGTGDVVFIPTLSFAEATGVRNLLARSEPARRILVSAVSPRCLSRPQPRTQEWQVHSVRNLLASFVPLAQRTMIKLCRQYACPVGRN